MKTLRDSRRWGRALVCGALLTGIAGVGGGIAPGPAAAAKGNPAGIGTEAARNSPLCDPETGRIKIPSYLAAVCVKPFPANGNNGGATYQGVTRNSIKVVVCVPPKDVQMNPTTSQPPRNRATGAVGLVEDAILDAQAAVDGRYELWGRKIEYVFVPYSGTDEAAQRADAVRVAAMKPFAVIDQACGPVFTTEIAKRKILVPWGNGSQKANLAQQPYRWSGQDANLQARSVATWIGNQIAKGRAEHAGDPALTSQPRRFGLVYTADPASGNDLDLAKFRKEMAKRGAKLAAEVAFSAPADATVGAQQTAAQEQAPTIVAKLKDQGVTSVILMVGNNVVGPLTRAATAANFRPEWLVTGWNLSDLSLLSAQYDQEQWAHAFGLAWFPPYAQAAAGAATGQNVIDWYWGTDKATVWSGAFPIVYWLNQGIMLAGPELTPETFRDGQFAQPGQGGAFEDMVTTVGLKVGDLGLGYPSYSLVGPKDFALVWWDPKAVGRGNVIGNNQTGNYVYVDGAKRYTLKTFPKQAPKFFTRQPGDVVHFDTPPPKDMPRTYPCDGCPSAGRSGSGGAA